MVKAKHVILVILGYLFCAWLAVILIDVANVFGLRDRLGIIVWATLFANGRPTEWVQWYALGTTALLSAFHFGALPRSNHERGSPGDATIRGCALFWGVLAVGVVLMLVEDAGNVRHEIRWFVEGVTGSPRHTGTIDKAVEFTYFAVVASVPLFALVRYGHHLRSYSTTLAYILSGYAFYGLAAAGNATRNWGGWYGVVGEWILLRFDMTVSDPGDTAGHGHWLVDALFEESLELMGAMFLLAAAVSFLGSAGIGGLELSGTPSMKADVNEEPDRDPIPS